MTDNNSNNNPGAGTSVTRTDQGSSTLGRLLVVGLVVGAAVAGFVGGYLLVLRAIRKPVTARTYAGLAAMATSYFGGRLCDRFGPLRIMRWSLVLTGLSFWALGLVPGRPAISPCRKRSRSGSACR